MKKLSMIGQWFYERMMLFGNFDYKTEYDKKDIYDEINNLCGYAYMWFLVLNKHNYFTYNGKKGSVEVNQRLFSNRIFINESGWMIKDHKWWAKNIKTTHFNEYYFSKFELDILNQVWDEYGKLYTSDELTDIVLQEELWNKHVDKKIGVFDKDPIMDWEVYMFILEKLLVVRKD